MIPTRTCSKCGETKLLSLFSKSGAGRDGRHTFCKICKATQTRAWMAANRHRLKAEAKQRYAADGTRQRKQALQWYRDNKDRSLESKRNWKLSVYGLTPEDYEMMLESQGRRCAICGKEGDSSRMRDLGVDHCHATQMVRGLLCRTCNLGLGHLGDSLELLKAAVVYLTRFSQRKTA